MFWNGVRYIRPRPGIIPPGVWIKSVSSPIRVKKISIRKKPNTFVLSAFSNNISEVLLRDGGSDDA
jgi:hypothetical protein